MKIMTLSRLILFSFLINTLLTACYTSPVMPVKTEEQQNTIVSEKPKPLVTKSAKPKEGPDDLNIMISIYNSQNDEEQKYLMGIENVFKTNNVKYKIYDAKGDIETQMFQIREAVREKPDALIVSAKDVNLIKDTYDAAKAKLPLISINYHYDDNSDIINEEVAAVEEAVKIMAEELKNGKIVFLNTGEEESLEADSKYLRDALTVYDKAITAAKNVSSYEEGANEISTLNMAYPDIKAIWANTSQAVDSALYMTDISNRNDINIIGVSGNKAHIDALKEGRLKALIFPYFAEMGEFAANKAISKALNKKIPIFSGNFFKVYTKDNIDTFQSKIAFATLSED